MKDSTRRIQRRPFPSAISSSGAKLGETGHEHGVRRRPEEPGEARRRQGVLRMTHRASTARCAASSRKPRAVPPACGTPTLSTSTASAARIDGGYFLVMDLVDGLDLEKRISRGARSPSARRPRSSPRSRAPSSTPTRNGIIHRDLKPSNVLLETRVAAALDGLRAAAKHLQEEIARLSGPNDVLGTPCYMAPEQADSTGAP